MFEKRPLKFRTTRHADQSTASDSDHIRVVGYVRVSTDMQAHEGVSLNAQSEKINAYCKRHDVELIGIYKDESLCAKSLGKPCPPCSPPLPNSRTLVDAVIGHLTPPTRFAR